MTCATCTLLLFFLFRQQVTFDGSKSWLVGTYYYICAMTQPEAMMDLLKEMKEQIIMLMSKVEEFQQKQQSHGTYMRKEKTTMMKVQPGICDADRVYAAFLEMKFSKLTPQKAG